MEDQNVASMLLDEKSTCIYVNLMCASIDYL